MADEHARSRSPRSISEEDELAGPSNIDERIAQATRRRDELKKKQQLKALDKEISRLENATADSDGSSSSSDTEGEVEEIPRDLSEIGSNIEPVVATGKRGSHARRNRDTSETPEPHLPKLRPMKLNEYHGKSIREHREWTRDAQTAFRQAKAYFRTEESKILYAMGFLKGDAKEMWYNHESEHPADTLTWKDFTTFLLDNIEDPVNRSLDAQQRFEDARQLQSQSVQQFSVYLEGVEAQLYYPFSEEQRVTQFFTKIRPELQIQITNVGRELPKTRAALLALAIRLEVNVKKTNPQYAQKQKNHNNGGQGGKKRKRDKGNDDHNDDNRNNGNKESQSKRKKKGGSSGNGKKDHSHLTCFNCGEPGHISTNCSEPKKDKDKPKVGSIGNHEVTENTKKGKPSSKTP